MAGRFTRETSLKWNRVDPQRVELAQAEHCCYHVCNRAHCFTSCPCSRDIEHFRRTHGLEKYAMELRRAGAVVGAAAVPA